MSLDSQAILEIFREEAREHLRGLEQAFLDLESETTLEVRREIIDHAFRHAHSMKSDAKVVGLPEVKQAVQVLEDLLDELRENPQTIDQTTITRGLTQFDLVKTSFENWQAGEQAEPSEPASEESTLSNDDPQLSPESTVQEEKPLERTEPTSTPSTSEESFTVRVPSERLDRMLGLAGEVRISQRSSDKLATHLDELLEQVSDLYRLAQQGQRTSRERTRTQQLMHSRATESDSSSLDRTLGQIGHSIEVLLDRMRRFDSSLEKKHSREALLLESLETDIRQARLLPLAMLADSLRRAVRDLSQSLGKPIRYQVDVGTVMLDKAVIEALKDPLMHIVRNAADHGLESREERIQAGKLEEGTLRIAASRRGSVVRITLEDDGKGLDYTKIRTRLARSGELSREEIDALSEQELCRYLFTPGFSTAQAGEVSGRGVGLDVVLHTIHKLQGNVEIRSEENVGTTFIITVPVSISTIRILSVVANGQFYGIPSTAVVRTGRATRSELREMEGNLVLPVNGQPVRWVHLAEQLGKAISPAAQKESAWPYFLIAREDELLAVAVEEFDDESEVLLKPLGFPLNSLPGVIGGTIRADGSVQLVLDLTGTQFARTAPKRASLSEMNRSVGKILVVDDSPTTRAVLRNVLTAAGYAVNLATDGIDALERLRMQNVDLVVSDVEMPRLNGFDLTRRIKSSFGLPVILVTGLQNEEHRRAGLEAGADAYVVKSTFEDEGLLEIVQQFV